MLHLSWFSLRADQPDGDRTSGGSASRRAAPLPKPWRSVAVSVALAAFSALGAGLAPRALAQNIIDGLPPPPSIPDLEPPPSQEAPSPAAQAAGTYRVLVNSDSPFLLEQVRRVEPTADFERSQGQFVIVAGQFDQRDQAEVRVEALAAQGIGAEIEATEVAAGEAADAEATVVEVTAAPDSTPTTSRGDGDDAFAEPGSSIAAGLEDLPPADLGQPPVQPSLPSTPSAPPVGPSVGPSAPLPTAQGSSELAGSDFYIVVPGDPSDLSRLEGQIALLGADPGAIAQREQPLGPHLLVGPFVSRESATRWNTFLRDFGMDARVYYRR
ncbi:MAG: hypothetical protein AAF289_03085 [Cyanobacteria bacterium P01_A01_bin.135]